MAAMLHARNNTVLFLWDKMFIMQTFLLFLACNMVAMQNLYTAVSRKSVKAYVTMPNGFMGNSSLPLLDEHEYVCSFIRLPSG